MRKHEKSYRRLAGAVCSFMERGRMVGVCRVVMRHVAGLLVSHPFRVLFEDGGGCYLLRLFLVELFAPSGTLAGVSPLPGVAILDVACGLLVVGFPPVVPSLGSYVLAQVALDEECVGIGSPRASEIHLVDALVGGEPATVEDVSIGLVCGSRCRRDV